MRIACIIVFLMGNFLCKELLAFKADVEHCSFKKKNEVPT